MVSFIVPVFNSEDTVEECIISLLNLDYPKDKIEIIVVDNASTDNSKNIIQKFPVKYIYCPLKGRSQARNAGVKNTTGDFLAFIDSDCVVEPNWLSELLPFFEKAYVGGAQGKVIPAQKKEPLFVFNYRTSLSKVYSFLILGMPGPLFPIIDTAGCIYRRTAFFDVDGFDEELPRHEDVDVARRIFYSGYALCGSDKTSVHKYAPNNSIRALLSRSYENGKYIARLVQKHTIPFENSYWQVLKYRSKEFSLFRIIDLLVYKFAYNRSINQTVSSFKSMTKDIYFFQKSLRIELSKKRKFLVVINKGFSIVELPLVTVFYVKSKREITIIHGKEKLFWQLIIESDSEIDAKTFHVISSASKTPLLEVEDGFVGFLKKLSLAEVFDVK